MQIFVVKLFRHMQPDPQPQASPTPVTTKHMKQDPSFKLVAIVILAGVITAFVAPDSPEHHSTEVHSSALAE
jgi:hypothetical protein